MLRLRRACILEVIKSVLCNNTAVLLANRTRRYILYTDCTSPTVHRYRRNCEPCPAKSNGIFGRFNTRTSASHVFGWVKSSHFVSYHLVMTFTAIAMENPPIVKNGKPSISIRAIEIPWLCNSHNQRVSKPQELRDIYHRSTNSPYGQWPFQEPKLEVPTIYKAYVRPM